MSGLKKSSSPGASCRTDRDKPMTDDFARLPPGTRVRLKRGVGTITGWSGTATILDDIRAIKDGHTVLWGGGVIATGSEWAKLRDQTPNPEHAEVLAKFIGDDGKL